MSSTTQFRDLPDRLAARLAQPPPGQAAQSKFAPGLSFGRHNGPPRFDAKPAAVLALLHRQQGQWYIPLTLRPDHLPDHAGQVCFPGGMTDTHESSEQSALRELEEELGVSADQVQVLGKISPLYVFASNFWVQPFVAVARSSISFRPNSAEVAEVVDLPVATLLDSNNYGRHRIDRQGIIFQAPHIFCGAHRIWGATCMMLAELAELLVSVFSDQAATEQPTCSDD